MWDACLASCLTLFAHRAYIVASWTTLACQSSIGTKRSNAVTLVHLSLTPNRVLPQVLGDYILQMLCTVLPEETALVRPLFIYPCGCANCTISDSRVPTLPYCAQCLWYNKSRGHVRC